MRLWSPHPNYLDSKGLVAVWREGLLARKVLQGKTRGYTKHPQLIRFKEHKIPLQAIDKYLYYIFCEAKARKYNFNRNKIDKNVEQMEIDKIKISTGQLKYELEHLLQKLETRDKNLYAKLQKLTKITPHPLFVVTRGGIASWERT